jgi:3'-phosphoadenosine 5'-phosphosulfate sulfotransferase (PAPS reductase)/FAD synthetase
MRHIVALSGGKDSTALALRLAEVEPRDSYEYVFTPTGDELPDMVEHWKRLMSMLGKPLRPLNNESLAGVIERNGALPNWRMRFCTRQIKIEPFIAYMQSAAPAMAYVGLRADEETREGTLYGESAGIEQRFPLREWGWGIGDVQDYLKSKGVEIPKRTDCARCFYQTLGEWYDLWVEHPTIYEDAVAMEDKHGHTFRSEQRDAWPAALKGLRAEFEGGRKPRSVVRREQGKLFGEEDMMRKRTCRICTM